MPSFYLRSTSTSIPVSGQPDASVLPQALPECESLAGEGRTGGEAGVGFPSLDYSETTAHFSVSPGSDAAPGLKGAEAYKHAYRVFGCKHCTTVHEYVALARCGDRTCPDCRKQDFYRLFNAYAPAVAGLGKHGLKLVTLTQKNRPDLEGCVDDLRQAWKRLRRRHPYKNVWRGGLYAIECVNKGRGWHVHMHILVQGGFIDQREIAADWLDLTGDSCIVDIRDVPKPRVGLHYVLKYLHKAPTVSGHEAEYNEVLKGTRLVQAFGTWYGQVKVKDEEAPPKLVCGVCGRSDWLVILHQPEMPLPEFRAQHEVMTYFATMARTG